MEDEKFEKLLEQWMEEEDLGALKELLEQEGPAAAPKAASDPRKPRREVSPKTVGTSPKTAKTTPKATDRRLTVALGTVGVVELVALVAVVLLWIL